MFALAAFVGPWLWQSMVAETYHEIVPTTHDDKTLDSAVVVLSGMADSLRMSGPHLVETFVHLLSTEASARRSRTAAEIIIRLEYLFDFEPDLHTLPFEPIRAALVRSALPSVHRRPLWELWTFPFLGAMAVLTGTAHPRHPPVVCILASQHALHLDPETLDLLFDICKAIFPVALPHPPHMVELFRPPFIAPRYVLQALHHLTPRQFETHEVIVTLVVAAGRRAAAHCCRCCCARAHAGALARSSGRPLRLHHRGPHRQGMSRGRCRACGPLCALCPRAQGPGAQGQLRVSPLDAHPERVWDGTVRRTPGPRHGGACWIDCGGK
ncbi:hypothetical protein DFH07DRAFT_34730 [Mycena maculata]|uniref:Uncharacterized protein n=1 Tax=Mycena maculata TaxID=230809 RepID=A0AAD7N3I0_9AGAR|nr:hypothetical protein DFH07DRAFT_34730 [Mycena maculata]